MRACRRQQANCWEVRARQPDSNDAHHFKSHSRRVGDRLGTLQVRAAFSSCEGCVERSRPLETALLLISLSGLGLVPLVYVATGIPRFAAYSFYPWLAWLGSLFAIAALGVFHLTHRALGRNWSISLGVRENHELVTEGIYRKVRHPMYSAFWLWAIAQALLGLPVSRAWPASGSCSLVASARKSE